MRKFGWALCNVVVATALVASAACSKGSTPADDDSTSGGDAGSAKGDSGGTNLPNPNTPGKQDAGSVGPGTSDGGSDGGIQGPTFDVTKVASISGTFVTDKTGLNGVNSNATVTWSFKIDNISDLTQSSGTATWNVQATNVVGGNMSDFPPDVNVALNVTNVSGQAEFNALDPNYVLVQVHDGVIADFYYYRRVISDTEPQPPPDKPHNVTYTVTTK